MISTERTNRDGSAGAPSEENQRSTDGRLPDRTIAPRRVGRRSVLSAVVTAAVTPLAGCSNVPGATETPTRTDTDAAVSGTVTVAGSSTVYPLTLRVGQQFSADRPEASVSVSPTGTGGGFEEFFCLGKADVNDASRPITAEERELCAENDVTFERFRVATDAVTVIVNDGADWVDCIEPDELAAIWRADGAETWADVRAGWPDEPIEHYGPSSDSGTYDYFAEEILGGGQAHRTDYEGTEQDSRIVESVTGSEHAIGYLGFAYYTQNADSVSALAIDDGSGCVSPSLESAKTGEYAPLSRPLFIYVSHASLRRPVVREFLRYYLARVDSPLVSEVGYVPLDEATASRNRERFEDVVDSIG